VVRYQTALRPDTLNWLNLPATGSTRDGNKYALAAKGQKVAATGTGSAFENLQNLFQLHANLADDLLTAVDVIPCFIPFQHLPRAADGVALLV